MELKCTISSVTSYANNMLKAIDGKLALKALDPTLPANHSPKPRFLQNTWTHKGRPEVNHRHDETVLVESWMQLYQITSCLIHR